MPVDKFQFKPVGAGPKNRRIEIQANQPRQQAGGRLAENWVTMWKVWASLTMYKGVEQYVQGQVAGHTFYYVNIWWRPGVTPDMRIKYTTPTGVRIFNIRSVDDIAERHREINLFVEELNGQ
jgi:SPP1 family predicted phage head-tail adaptor